MGSSNENSAFGPSQQSVGARSHSRRVERRIRGRRGRRHDAARRSARTPADRSASRPRCAASSGSSRRTAACRATACSRSGRRSIRSARSRGRAHDAAIALGVIAGADPADATSASRDVDRLRRGADRRHPRPAHRRAVADARQRASMPDISRAFRRRRSTRCGHAARQSSTSSCRTRSTRSRSTTSSRPRRRARTSHATTASATACGIAERRSGRDVRELARQGLRRRGETTHHARHLRAQRRLLRRVLSEGAAGAHAHPSRLRRGVRTRRRRRDADEPDPAVQDRREDGGSAADVPRRRLHRQREPGRACRRSACRAASRRPAADWPAADRTTFDESTLLRIADAYERDTEWWKQQPPIAR